MAKIDETLADNITAEIELHEDEISKHGGININFEDIVTKSHIDSKKKPNIAKKDDESIEQVEQKDISFEDIILDEMEETENGENGHKFDLEFKIDDIEHLESINHDIDIVQDEDIGTQKSNNDTELLLRGNVKKENIENSESLDIRVEDLEKTNFEEIEYSDLSFDENHNNHIKKSDSEISNLKDEQIINISLEEIDEKIVLPEDTTTEDTIYEQTVDSVDEDTIPEDTVNVVDEQTIDTVPEQTIPENTIAQIPENTVDESTIPEIEEQTIDATIEDTIPENTVDFVPEDTIDEDTAPAIDEQTIEEDTTEFIPEDTIDENTTELIPEDTIEAIVEETLPEDTNESTESVTNDIKINLNPGSKETFSIDIGDTSSTVINFKNFDNADKKEDGDEVEIIFFKDGVEIYRDTFNSLDMSGDKGNLSLDVDIGQEFNGIAFNQIRGEFKIESITTLQIVEDTIPEQIIIEASDEQTIDEIPEDTIPEDTSDFVPENTIDEQTIDGIPEQTQDENTIEEIPEDTIFQNMNIDNEKQVVIDDILEQKDEINLRNVSDDNISNALDLDMLSMDKPSVLNFDTSELEVVQKLLENGNKME